MVRPHRFTAVLDACVLYPAPVRDLLLSFAAAGVCGARWIVGRTDAIITFNLKDFPDTCTSVHGIKILHPDDFIVAQYLREPAKILSIISGLRARLKNRPCRQTACFRLMNGRVCRRCRTC